MLARFLAKPLGDKRLDRLYLRSKFRSGLMPYGSLQTLLNVLSPRSGVGRVACFGDSVLKRISRDGMLTTGRDALVKT